MLRSILIVLLPLAASQVESQEFDEPDRLFRSNDVLELRIAAPLTTLVRKRPDEEEMPGTVSWQDETGATVTVAAQIRARGNFRRQHKTCSFPPLRLNFKKSEVKDTLFDKQDKVKLVTHCENRNRDAEQNIFREYLAYRILNQLTDMSFRVRLLRITYENTEADGDERTEHGFIIESEQRLGKRTHRPPLDLSATSVEALDPAYTNLSSLFQYLIGNTDFSPIAGPEGKSCCHNMTLFAGEGMPQFPVPYDFDMSGFVDTEYATPNPKFSIREVTTRLYRGRCQFNNQVPATIAQFRKEKETIYALIASQTQLNKRSHRELGRFVDKFFATIEDPSDVEKEITAECVG